MKPSLEKILLICGSLVAIMFLIFLGVWVSIKEKKVQMDDLFNNTNPPTGFHYQIEDAPKTIVYTLKA